MTGDEADLPTTIWVAQLHISWRTAEKIQGVHHLEPQDVRDELQCVQNLDMSWDYDERGWRAIVEARVKRGTMLAVLYPTPQEDEWNLGSIYFV